VNARYELTRNWITKAENDFKTGWDEFQTEKPATDMVCFHMQQCVEKYLKAYLVVHSMAFRRTHDIAELVELCKQIDTAFGELYCMNADSLTIYGVSIRYPDDFYVPTTEEAEKALRIARSARDFVKDALFRSRAYAALLDA
jgi:HEPN domain-containing protein